MNSANARRSQATSHRWLLSAGERLRKLESPNSDYGRRSVTEQVSLVIMAHWRDPSAQGLSGEGIQCRTDINKERYALKEVKG
jgi:hypothetical protein